MRVLLTNHSLAERGGTELYVRDVAKELLRRGHLPVAFSTRLGSVAEELRAATIPAISDLSQLGEAPDVIHGHHHYETLIALLRFPATPAIYFCHGWLPWQEAPLVHPQIMRYAGVSQRCCERLICEGGIPAGRVAVTLNFYDEDVFPARPPLPAQPRSAALFGHAFREDADLNLVEACCRRLGISLDTMGTGTGRAVDRPSERLSSFDIVFGSGRCAIEAAAVGASVILCGYGHMGPCVTTANFAEVRRLNFGLGALTNPVDEASITHEIKAYDPVDALKVSKMVRAQCGLKSACDYLLELYNEVIAEWAAAEPPSPRDSIYAVARYLEEWAGQYNRSSEVKLRMQSAEAELKALHQSASWHIGQKLVNSWPGRAVQSFTKGFRSGRSDSDDPSSGWPI